MSEDTAHGQHYEPQVQQAGKQVSVEELLKEQAHEVEVLGTRVASLIMATLDTFNEFVVAQQMFFLTLTQQRPTDARPTVAGEGTGQARA